MLHRAHTTGAAVADKAGRLVVPLAVDKVDGILQGAADAMVVLWRHEYETVERIDLRGPSLGVFLGVLSHRWRHRFIEQRQVEILDVDQLELCLRALLGKFVNPLGDGLANAPRSGAANDDCDFQHDCLSAKKGSVIGAIEHSILTHHDFYAAFNS